MHNYTLIMSALLTIVLTFCYWPITWFEMFVTKTITKEMRSFPWIHFLVMAFFDSFYSIVVTIVASFLSGPMNIVLGQSVICWNLVLSYVLLGSRFNALHVGGVMIVFIGITLSMDFQYVQVC
jgi:drug/metabolite transporter (DMT)-like permease